MQLQVEWPTLQFVHKHAPLSFLPPKQIKISHAMAWQIYRILQTGNNYVLLLVKDSENRMNLLDIKGIQGQAFALQQDDTIQPPNSFIYNNRGFLPLPLACD
jgi:hypothetical protein